MKTKYLMYQCPNCHAFTNTPGPKPLKCAICNRTICFECVEYGMCTHCKRALKSEEYQELKSNFKANPFVIIFTISLVIFDIVAGLYVVSGLLFDEQQKLMWGGIGFLIGMIPTFILFSKGKKNIAQTESYYVYLKQKINERTRS